MAALGTVGYSNTAYTAVVNPVPIANRLAGVGYGSCLRGAVGYSNFVYSCVRSPLSYTTRLAGAGGTKGIASGGGGGAPTRTFSRGGVR